LETMNKKHQLELKMLFVVTHSEKRGSGGGRVFAPDSPLNVTVTVFVFGSLDYSLPYKVQSSQHNHIHSTYSHVDVGIGKIRGSHFFPTHIGSKAWVKMLQCFELQSLVAMPGHTGEVVPACLFLDIPVMVLARDYSTATILHCELRKKACLGSMFLNDVDSKLKWHAAKVSKFKTQNELVKFRVKKRKQEEEESLVPPPSKRRKMASDENASAREKEDGKNELEEEKEQEDEGAEGEQSELH